MFSSMIHETSDAVICLTVFLLSVYIIPFLLHFSTIISNKYHLLEGQKMITILFVAYSHLAMKL